MPPIKLGVSRSFVSLGGGVREKKGRAK
jgi:hypothetical protein